MQSTDKLDSPESRPNSPVLVESDGDVAHVILNRPHALNALCVPLLDRILLTLEDVRDASAVVLYGNGRAFCAGEDLRETLAPQTGEAEELRESFEKLQQITRKMTALRAPIVVAAHGYAIGGGAELALAADIVVAGRDLQMRFPEVPIGHAVTGGITARLSAAVGLMRAKELLLTGRWIGADEAHQIGIAIGVADDAIARAKELGSELGSMPRRSMAATKLGLELASVPNQEIVLNSEVDAAVYCFSSADAEHAHIPFQRDASGNSGRS